jgi:O-methyltransferase
MRLSSIFRKKKTKIGPWVHDSNFERLYEIIKPRTLVTKDRCFTIYQWARYASRLEGDFAEVGVYRGGTAYMTAALCPGRSFYLFDTFSGMPKTDKSVDYHNQGEFSDTSLDGVRNFLKEYCNISLQQGFFPESTRLLPDSKFSYVHVDVDIYQSTLDCLKYFYPRLTRGGVMIFDDYEWKHCDGVKKAIDEFLADKPERVIISALCQGLLIKQ